MALSEREQLELFANWWKENGTALAVTIVVSVAAYFGWTAWKNHAQTQAEKASAIYQELLDAMDKEGNIQAHLEKANTLKNEYASTFYGPAARLLLAEQAMKDGQLAVAAEELKAVVAARPDEVVLITARLRLARVLYAQEQYEEALKQLEGSVPEAYTSLYAELRGDIQLAQGKPAEARASWQSALDALEGDTKEGDKKFRSQGPGVQTLEMKINSVNAP